MTKRAQAPALLLAGQVEPELDDERPFVDQHALEAADLGQAARELGSSDPTVRALDDGRCVPGPEVDPGLAPGRKGAPEAPHRGARELLVGGLAHGVDLDVVEITAMKRVFEDPSKVTINATKSLIGHSLGAAGGIAAVVVVKAIQESKVHPTLNFNEDPEPDLGFNIPTKAEDLKIKVAISNSFGFGGHNAAVAFAAYTP